MAGHYFTEDLSRFDAPFFNMTNAEAEVGLCSRHSQDDC